VIFEVDRIGTGLGSTEGRLPFVIEFVWFDRALVRVFVSNGLVLVEGEYCLNNVERVFGVLEFC